MEERFRQFKFFKALGTSIVFFFLVACSPTVKTVLPPGTNLTERGILDISVAFLGAGNYSGYDALVLPPSRVCTDKTVFGIQGTAICEQSGAGPTALPSQVITGAYYWDGTGASIAGTLSDRGFWDLRTSFPGAGFFSGITSAPTASDFCNTKTFLGSLGTSVCQSGSSSAPASNIDVQSGKEYWDSTGTKQTGTGVCNSISADLLSSNACRADTATVNLGNAGQVAARARAVLSDEAAGNTTYTNNHLLVPNPKYDTDGQDDDAGIGTTLRHYLVTVKGRPDKVCGLSGSLSTRIDDCLTQNGTKSSWEGKKYGIGGEADWKLVTLYKSGAAAGAACAGGSAAGCYEVWRDERTQLIWSDYLNNNGDGYNWFRAAGYSSNASTVAVTGKEGRAGVGTDCLDSGSNPEVCQPATPISVCAPAASIANLNGVATYQNPDGTNATYDETPAKGNISTSWRLPTYADWAQAYVDGIAKVLPSMTGSVVFWTATSHSTDRNQAWIVGWYGLMYPSSRDQVFAVRCVGF